MLIAYPLDLTLEEFNYHLRDTGMGVICKSDGYHLRKKDKTLFKSLSLRSVIATVNDEIAEISFRLKQFKPASYGRKKSTRIKKTKWMIFDRDNVAFGKYIGFMPKADAFQVKGEEWRGWVLCRQALVDIELVDSYPIYGRTYKNSKFIVRINEDEYRNKTNLNGKHANSRIPDRT